MINRARPLALATLLLAGCTSTKGDNTYNDVWKVMQTSVAASFGKVSVTRDQAAAVPYANMGWRLGDGNQSLIVLATDNGGELMWTSAARIVLTTRDGRLVRSVGLGYDLGGVMPKGGAPLPAPFAAIAAPFNSTRLVDLPDTGSYGVEITCRSHAVVRQTITILGRATATMRVDEDCYSPSLRWRFTDSYWVDPQDGTVWRARQHFHPRQDVLETTLFRPPG